MTADASRGRATARWVALVAVAVGVAAGAWWLTHRQPLRLDELTRAEAERAAVSGALYLPRACPRPARVRCRAQDRHWRCRVVFPSGAAVEGDPADPYGVGLQIC